MFLYYLFLTHIIYITNAAVDIKGLTKAELAELEQKTMTECLKKHSVNETLLSEFLNEETSESTSKEFKCVLGCYTEEMGYGKDKKPQWDVMEEVHKIEYDNDEDKEKALKIVKTCKTIVPEEVEDSCELGFAMHSCYLDQSKKVGLLLV
uniref:Putative odorant-binding protein n=1 Tax=Triatoma brasiliensis TaxID=65344 RepID=A0A162X343_TRIBS|nr:putative odorant-binding protein [Triatoma brasiliensis]